MIRLENLSKHYGRLAAVDSLNLEVQSGEIFGFLGPNGAGKTTTIRVMMGILRATSGRVTLGGYDMEQEPEKAKAITGFIPDRPFIYEKLSGREFLKFVGSLHRVDAALLQRRISELLERFELSDWKDELVESYSHGMKQRLVLSASLIHQPKILIVDEPMVGIDPKGARMLKDLPLDPQHQRRRRDLPEDRDHSQGETHRQRDHGGSLPPRQSEGRKAGKRLSRADPGWHTFIITNCKFLIGNSKLKTKNCLF